MNNHIFLKPFYFLFFLLLSANIKAQFDCPEIENDCGDVLSDFIILGTESVVCDGYQFFVQNQSDTTDIAYIVWDWDDGLPPTVIYSDFNEPVGYIYNIVPEDVCDDDETDYFICMAIYRQCTDGYSAHSTQKPVTVIHRPLAFFEVGGPYCVNDPVDFLADECNQDNCFWEFEDGTELSGCEVDHSFSTPGNHEVTLTVTKLCEGVILEDSYITTVNVIGLPEADANYSTSTTDGCVPATFLFENLSNSYSTGFDWEVIGGQENIDWAFVNSSAVYPDTSIAFYTAGIYTVRMTADNICGEDVWETTIEVYDVPTAILQAPPDQGCNTYIYHPEVEYGGTISDILWSFEQGDPATSTEAFPGTIQFNEPGTFEVKLEVMGPCDTIELFTSVVVNSNQPPIFDPVGTLCSTDDAITLNANLPDGTWSGPGIVDQEEGIFDPSLANIGSNMVQYVAGPPDCQSTGVLEIVVLQSTLISISAPDSVCLDGGLVQVQYSPNDGTWSGNGISEDGIFDPMAAGAGIHPLQYEYVDPISYCISTKSINIQVVEVPTLSVPSYSICQIDEELDLQSLLSPQFSPAYGDLDWDGPGVVNGEEGIFNPDEAGQGTHALLATYTLPLGCDTTVYFGIEVTAYQVAEAGAEVEICANQAVYQLVGIPDGGVWTGLCVTPDEEVDLNCLTTGPHIFTYTLNGGTLCESTDQMEFTLFGNGVNAGPDLYACENEGLIDLPNGNPLNGNWIGSGLTGGQIEISALSPGTFTYTYEVPSFPEECRQDSFKLHIHEVPVAAFTFPDTGCLNVEIEFENLSTNATAYYWEFSDGGFSQLQHAKHSFGSNGYFEVILKARSLAPNGTIVCESVFTDSIFILSPPDIPELLILPEEGCAELCVEIIPQNTDAATVLDFGNGNTGVGDGPFYECYGAGVNGDTAYMVTVISSNFCSDTENSSPILVSDRPRAAIGYSTLTPCSGMTIEASNLSTNHPDSNEFFLNGIPLPMKLNGLDPLPFQLSTGNDISYDTLMLVAWNGCGRDTAELIFEVNPTDVSAVFSLSDTVVCVGETLTLNGFPTPGAPFWWEISDTTTYTGLLVEHVFLDSGNFEITMYVEGCGYASMTRKVKVDPLPDIALIHPISACFDEAVTIELETDAPAHFLILGPGDTSLANTVIHAFPSIGDFYLRAEATSINGCKATIQDSITVHPLPTPIISGADSICARTETMFANSGSGIFCEWYFPGNDISDSCQVSYAFPNHGNQTVKLVSISDKGCRDSVFREFYVHITPTAVPEVQILEPCSPGLVELSSSSIDAMGLEWNVNGFPSQASSFVYEADQGGSYQGILIASRDNLCTDTATFDFLVHPTPNIQLEVDPNCKVIDGVDLSIDVVNDVHVVISGSNYQDSCTYCSNLLEGDYWIVASSQVSGCETDTAIHIEPPQELSIALPRDSFRILLGDSVQLELEVNLSDALIQWTPDIGLNNPNIANPVAKPTQTSIYEVEVTNGEGECPLTKFVFVQVITDRDSLIYVPNAFSPNGDGINDVFMVYAGKGVSNIEQLVLYDRWGERVFEQYNFPPNNPAYGWNGKLDGLKMNAAVFTWKIIAEFSDGDSHES
ncbi:MAG: PKD domain-containing protein, partial [Bacteroidota bacterium]